MHDRSSGRIGFVVGGVALALFAVLAALLLTVDVQPIAADGSDVGLGALNAAVHGVFGENELMGKLSDVLIVAPAASMLVLAVVGVRQIVDRRSLAAVDRDLWLLLALYVVMLVLYVLFNHMSLNNRPVFEDGVCEPSFPSSHTLLAVVTLGAAMVQAAGRLREGGLRTAVFAVCAACMVLLVAARLLSGVHWATDILGGVLLGAALVGFYQALAFGKREEEVVRGKHARR